MAEFEPGFEDRPALRFGFLLYKKAISPFFHGMIHLAAPVTGGCRFRPTCSEYAYIAVERYGLAKGGWLGAKRLLRCHPFARGGQDEVP